MTFFTFSTDVSEAQQARPSPSETHSIASNPDSEFNISDQSISSLPNCKSPDIALSKSSELLLPSRSPELAKTPDSNPDSKLLGVPLAQVLPMSPEQISSSSESLSKYFENAKDKPKISERISSKSPELLKMKAAQLLTRDSKSLIRKRDEKFVTAASELMEEDAPVSLIEAAANVASSLGGAVEAVIQSSPRARRRIADTAEAMRIVEGSHITPERDEDLANELFRKCDKKKSQDENEGHPNFALCRVKPEDFESVPLLGSFEQDSGSESDHSRKGRRLVENAPPGSSWSLGRSDRLFSLESQRRQKQSSARKRYPDRPVVRLIKEDTCMVEQQPPYVSLRQRRNIRSHSLSLYNTDAIHLGSLDDPSHQHLTKFAEKLSQKLLKEIDHGKSDGEKHMSASLPEGLEIVEDSYLSQLSEELSDLSRLTAELHERNTYLASLSDEDLSREVCRIHKNPFYAGGNDDIAVSSNPFSSQLPSNPFLADSFALNEEATSPSSLKDSFLSLEIDSPQMLEQFQEPTDIPECVDTVDSITVAETSTASSEKPTAQSISMPTELQRKPSIITTDTSIAGVLSAADIEAILRKREMNATLGNSMESNEAEGSEGSRKDPIKGISRDNSRITITSSQGHSIESTDLDISDGSRKDGLRGIPRDSSRVTIASSQGHSIESSDPDGSEYYRRETSRVTPNSASMGWLL